MIEKFCMIVMGIFLVLCAGSCNIYPIYLQKLMDRFDLTISEVNFYGTCVNLGLWIAFPMGFIYDNFGPKISCLLGTIFLSGGYLSLHFVLNYEMFSNLSLLPLLILGYVLGQGSALFYTTAITTNLKNFRFKESSTIVGLLASTIAISPSIFTTYRETWHVLNNENFFLYLAIFLATISILAMLLFSNLDYIYSEDKNIRAYEKYKEKNVILWIIYFNLFTIIIYLFGVLYNYFSNMYLFPLIIIYPCMQLLNFSVLLLEKFEIFDKVYWPRFKHKAEMLKGSNIELKLYSIESPNEIWNKSIEPNKEEKSKCPNQEGDYISPLTSQEESEESETSFLSAIRSPKLLLLFVALVLGIGSVISNLNNINFVLKSLSYKIHFSGANKGIISIYKNKELFLYVIFYFIFNSTTRIASGMILDYLIIKRKFFYYFSFFCIVGLCSQLIGIFMKKDLLYISIALAGATHGGYMTFTPVFVRILFGLKNMGMILGFLTSGSALGSFIVSDFIFIAPYQHYSALSDSGKCYGTKCFTLSYILTSSFFIINFVISLILLKFYGEAKISYKTTNSAIKRLN